MFSVFDVPVDKDKSYVFEVAVNVYIPVYIVTVFVVAVDANLLLWMSTFSDPQFLFSCVCVCVCLFVCGIK